MKGDKKMELLSVQRSGNNGKFFIMGNHGQLENTPYYTTMKQATIAMFRMNSKGYTNIYDMPQKAYERKILGKGRKIQ